MSDPVQDILDQIEQDGNKTAKLKQSMGYGFTQNPDQASNAHKVATKLGTSQAYASGNMQALTPAAASTSFDYDAFIKNSPSTANWVSNPDNASMAHDDLTNLAETESHINMANLYSLTPEQKQAVIEERKRVYLHNKTRDEVTSAVSSTNAAFYDPFLSFGKTVAAGVQLGADVVKTGMDVVTGLRAPGQAIEDVKFAARNLNSGGAGKLIAQGADASTEWLASGQKTGPSEYLIDPKTGNKFKNPDSQTFDGKTLGKLNPILDPILNRNTWNTVAGLPGAIAGFAVGGEVLGPKGMPTIMAANATRDKYEKALREGADIPTAAMEGIGSGTFNYALMTALPHPVEQSSILGSAAQVLKRGTAMGLTSTVVENSLARLHNPDQPLLDGATQNIISMIGFEASGAIPGMISMANESKLKARNVEKYREYIAEVTKGTPLENLRIPVEQFETYFQTAGMDPGKVAEILGATKEYQDAKAGAGGSDVVIRTADLLSRLGKKHLDGLEQDIRPNEDAMTPRQRDTWVKEGGPERLQKAVEEEVTRHADNPEFVTIRDEISKRLQTGQGMTKAVADTHAEVGAVQYMNAERAGMSPTEFYKAKNPEFVTGEAPQGGLSQGDAFGDVPSDLTPLQKQNREQSNYIVNEALPEAQAKMRQAEDRLKSAPEDYHYEAQSAVDSARAELAIAERKAEFAKKDPYDPQDLSKYERELIKIDSQKGEDWYSDLSSTKGGDAEASKYLHSLGISGIKYLDGSSRSQPYEVVLSTSKGEYSRNQFDTKPAAEQYAESKRGEGFSTVVQDNEKAAHNYVIFDDAAVKILETYYQGQDKTRGWFSILPDGSFQIGRTPFGDASTPIHEALGHSSYAMLRDLAAMPTASEQLKADFTEAHKWMGVEEGQTPTREQHEKWAKAVELYFTEGKSPTQRLREAFQRIAVWMGSVYKQAEKQLGVEISPELREVFKRWFAATDAVEKAQSELSDRPLTAEQLGWTDAEYQKHAEANGLSLDAARQDILAKLNEVAVRDRSTQWREDESNVRQTVTEQIDALPEYKTIRALRLGKMEDGTELSLNKDELVKQFGEARVKALHEQHRNLYRNEGGVDAETAAEILGYNSADEMMKSLEGAQRRSTAISEATRQEMTRQFGDIRYDGTLEDQAKLAVMNEARDKNLHRELQALDRRNNPEHELREAKREAARLIKEQEAEQKAKETKSTAKDMTSLSEGLLKENAKQSDKIDARDKRIEELKTKIADLETKAKEESRSQDAGRRFANATPSIESFRDAAREMIQSKPIMDMNPATYLNASRKFGMEAFTLANKNDFWGARQAKQKELINHFLFREATAAKAEAEKIYSFDKTFDKASLRLKIAKAGEDEGQHVYLDQIDNVRAMFQFSKMSNAGIADRQKAFLEFAAQEQINAANEFYELNPEWRENHPNETPDIGQKIDTSILGFAKNYRELTIGELRAYRDALKNLKAVALNSYTILRNGHRVEFKLEVARLSSVSRSANTVKVVPRQGEELTLKERALSPLHTLDANLQKLENFVDALDGHDILGPARANIKKPIDDANGKRLALADDIYKKLEALTDARPKDDVADRLSETDIQLPEDTRPATRKRLVSLLMNLGNEENRKVALIGEGFVNSDGSINPLMDKLLKGTFRKSELLYVQGVWDTLKSMQPAVAEKSLRTTGKEPTWKKLTPFDVTTVDGEVVHMQGGYFPLAGEPGDKVGMKQNDPANQQAIGFRRPKTSTSHLQDVSGATYRLNLDHEMVLARHLSDVITDTTMGEAISQVYKFITDPTVKTAIRETLGAKEEAEILPWLQDLTGNGKSSGNDNNYLVSLLLSRKSGMVAARLAGNLSSYMIQGGDVFKSIADPDIKTKYIAGAFLDIRRNPAKMIAMIREKSPNEMRFREENAIREIREMLTERNIFDKHKQLVTNFLMSGFQVMDRFVTFPAWLGRYRQGLAEHGNEERAIMEADRAIAKDYQAGDNRNMSKVMRQGGLMKILTTFQGDNNTWYGILSSSIRSGDPKAISVGIMALVAEQIVGQYIKNRGPKDDETWAGWAAEQALLGGVGKIPMIGDWVQYGWNKSQGKYASISNPTLSGVEKSITGFASIAKLKSGDTTFLGDVAPDLFEAIGIWTGIPMTSQAVRSWKYLHKVQAGKENPANLWEGTRSAIFGKTK